MDRSSLARLLYPHSIAVVGASENLAMSNNAILAMLDHGVEPILVNPNRPQAYGRRTVPSLSELGMPVDAVLALVSAERSVAVAEEAAAIGCGGVVVAAGGFGELGEQGQVLEGRLRTAATSVGMAVVGPNCSGFINVGLHANLFTGGRIELRPGPVAVISQSGFLVRACLAAGLGRQLGFSVAVSSGNETVCGLADYIDVFVEDSVTEVICLVVEKVRDPEHFFAAVRKAHEAGKEVIAVKLGRTDAARRIMQSHTGAIAGESWIYEVGFRQVGVHTARDIDEMMDKAQLLAQIPVSKRNRVRGVAVVTSSGGVAAMAADSASDFAVDLPVPEEAAAWLRDTIPGGGTLNPLDMTGFVMRDSNLLESLFERIAASSAIDAVVLCWWAAEGDEGWARTLLEPLAAIAARTDKPVIVTPVEATSIGSWTEGFKTRKLSFCRGIDSTYRALTALDHAASRRLSAATPQHSAASATSTIHDLSDIAVVDSPAGMIVSFGDAMRLLREAGFAVAPFVLVGPAEVIPDVSHLGGRLVVKLANVAHRSEIGAVKLGVLPRDLPRAVQEMRGIAAREGTDGVVAVQAAVEGDSEAFVGVQAHSDLGAVVLFGRGGVGVEAERSIDGRILPLGDLERDEWASQVAAHRERGRKPWGHDAVSDVVASAQRLWALTAGWLESVDVNPLVATDGGLVAVDALVVVGGAG